MVLFLMSKTVNYINLRKIFFRKILQDLFFIYKTFSYKSIPQVTLTRFVQKRKNNPNPRIKRGKGF